MLFSLSLVFLFWSKRIIVTGSYWCHFGWLILLSIVSLSSVFHCRHFALRMKRDTTLFTPDLVIEDSGDQPPLDTSHIYSGEIFGETSSTITHWQESSYAVYLRLKESTNKGSVFCHCNTVWDWAPAVGKDHLVDSDFIVVFVSLAQCNETQF